MGLRDCFPRARTHIHHTAPQEIIGWEDLRLVRPRPMSKAWVGRDGWVTACWGSWDFVRKNKDGRRLKKKKSFSDFLG